MVVVMVTIHRKCAASQIRLNRQRGAQDASDIPLR